MQRFLKSDVLSTGLAMFSMFFGAGNVIFPLLLGQWAGDKNIFAILGLCITAVLVPFTGLIGMMLYEGDYEKFFARIGKGPGFVLALLIMGLIGPFGGMPRCIALSHATFSVSHSECPLWLFSVIACVVIFAFTWNKNKIVKVLGYVLTPLLLGSLLIIIVKGMLFSPAAPIVNETMGRAFLHGILEGYNTLDLLAAFFFSTIVITALKESQKKANVVGKEALEETSCRRMLSITFRASMLGAFLLTAVYVGFSFIASFHSQHLPTSTPDQLLGVMAFHLLGPQGGWIANAAVSLACLTTAVTLAAVFSEFLETRVFQGKVGYAPCLLITLVGAFLISKLKFTGIVAFLLPILEISYPALILLTLLNIAYKLFNFRPVKFPVFATFAIALLLYLL